MSVLIFQTPDPPVSYYHAGGTPSLARVGPTSLRVTYGAALFDGGDRITAFQVYETSQEVDVAAVDPVDNILI